MRSFNRDRRVFCALLSTRSRAPGVSLVEADAVVFYDHDLDPVLDAQAQQWCDRIGRRKDVHVYRCGPCGARTCVRRSAQCGAASLLPLKTGAGVESGVGWFQVGASGGGPDGRPEGLRGPAPCCVGGGHSGLSGLSHGAHEQRCTQVLRSVAEPTWEGPTLPGGLRAALCCLRSPVLREAQLSACVCAFGLQACERQLH